MILGGQLAESGELRAPEFWAHHTRCPVALLLLVRFALLVHKVLEAAIFRLSRQTSAEGDFLPDLCSVQAVFSLVIVGELLSFAFVVIANGVESFDWLYFGTLSFLVQWIVLASAAALCPLRPWFRAQNGIVAGTVSYSIVLLMTTIFTLVGQWLDQRNFFDANMQLLDNLIIAAIFAGVVLRWFYLQQQLQNREQAALRSRIQALQSRIRPHFLFNSMNSIASLIDVDPEAAEKMVVDLSELFRASLMEPGLVAVEDEITLCKQFVSIEKTRLGARLQVEWAVDLKEGSFKIPSLMLQPLLENAIYHGIQSLAEGGKVKVSVSRQDNYARIQIGNPMSRNVVERDKRSNGIALDNIRHRLLAHYGEDATMLCESLGDAYHVDIRYPVKESAEEKGT